MNKALRDIASLDGYTFYIPDYQRGYRWTDTQIDNLLADLLAFVRQKKRDTFFLEPIVVKARAKDEYELIDGQQRLTTLFLLGHIFEAKFQVDMNPVKFRLVYPESRDNQDFMEAIKRDPFCGEWPGSDSCPDFYFIAAACRRICAWLDKPEHKRAAIDILKAMAENIKFLWQDTSEEATSPAETFERLNTGKIALTDGELTRSLLLIRQNVESELPSLKGFSQEDKNTLLPRLARSLIARRQIVQADNWDEGEKLLHDDAFWEFLGNPGPFQTRMDFLLQLHYGLKPESGDQYACFDMLYKEASENCGAAFDGYTAWGGIKQSLQRLWDWYNDPDYYHWIGYLSRVSRRELQELLKLAAELPAPDFRNEIIRRIRESIGGNVDPDEMQYESGSEKKPWKILFLLNVEYARKRPLGYARFPFAQFSSSQSIEHISARNPEAVKSVEQIKNWLATRIRFLQALTKMEIEAVSCGSLEREKSENVPASRGSNPDLLWHERERLLKDMEELLKDYNNLKRGEGPAKLADRFNRLFESFDSFMKALEDSVDVNSLYNLCLIDKDLNASLGNDEFPGKQQKIRTLLTNGEKYIPPATQALFMRHFMKNEAGRSWWSKDDRGAYRLMLLKTLSLFWPEFLQKIEAERDG